MKNCNCHTEISTDGSSQLGRYLKALDPGYVDIDGRSIEELLVFAKRYAAQIRFYDIPESSMNDHDTPGKVSWREFFRRDMAVTAASISETDVQSFRKEYDEVTERLQLHPSADIFSALFAPITGMLKKIDRWYTVAIPGNPLYEDMSLAIQSSLKEQTQKMIAYQLGFKYVDPKYNFVSGLDEVENKAAWGIDEPVDPDPLIYEGSSAEERILSAALFVDEIFHSFYSVLLKLVNESPKYMEFALEKYPAHQPHMALFITFLQLFRLAQDQLNGLTGKMLDFYYKDVLHLETKPSVPDKVHIVFELAKDVAEYDVAAGSGLKAGKDDNGIEQLYKTDEDLVVNQAKVKELKTIFVEKTKLENADPLQVVHSVFARPVANSADGLGSPFTVPEPKWPTFGVGNPANTKPKNICDTIDLLNELSARNDEAKVGFAIASPQLLMQGGKRMVEIRIKDADALLALQEKLEKDKDGNLFEIWFTGEKEWFKVDQVFTATEKLTLTKFLKIGIFNPADVTIGSGYFISKETSSVFVYLPASEQAVIAYDAKTHSAFKYNTSQPVMQVMLNPVIDLKASEYKNLSAANLSLVVKVGSVFPEAAELRPFLEDLKKNNITITPEEAEAILDFPADGLSKLVLQTETGVVAAGKPFDPFTAYPVMGKSFYIGSDEVFNKPQQKIGLFIKKTQDSDATKVSRINLMKESVNVGGVNVSDGSDYMIEIRERRNWTLLSDKNGSNFTVKEVRRNILHTPGKKDANGTPQGSDDFVHPRLPVLPVKEYTIGSEKGFLQITNLASTRDDMQSRQNQAASLEIKEVYVNYLSKLEALDMSVDEFYHVYPFGVVPIFVENTAVIVANPDEVKGKDVIIEKKGIAMPVKATINLKKEMATASYNLLKYKLDMSKFDTGKILVDKISAVQTKKVDFASLDTAKGYLLVDAGSALLPQFTYTSPYEQYSNSTAAARLAAAKNMVTKTQGDAAVNNLMLNASGLLDKVQGGANQYSALVQEEGMLFIGLEKAVPLQMISLLFEFAEGSAQDEDNDPPPIHWSYLTYNEWRPMKEESIISDGTFGFQATGIVKIELPEDATNTDTIISGGLHWLCASVTKDSNRIPMLINVVAQAVQATFSDNNNAQTHFDKALAAGSISKLEVAVAEISKVSQPFASYDGKHKEVGREFYTRVSERLRHKARAVTAWDYEHLVLDRFPSVYKVKCITHTDPNCICREPNQYTNPKLKDHCCGPQVAPGHVLIVPIANLKNRNAVNPLQPKTSRLTLLGIESWIKKHTSPFVHVHARNPVYEQVLVFFRVQFYKGYEKGFYMKKLNDEIVHFLTPWAFDEDTDVKFGQKIYASSIINFIEERDYVDFITDFLMVVCRKECCPDVKLLAKDANGKDEGPAAIFDKICGCSDMEVLLEDSDMLGEIVAKPSTPRSILVSVPQHIIVPYEAPEVLSPCESRKKGVVKETRLFTPQPKPVERTPLTPAVDVAPKDTVVAAPVAADAVVAAPDKSTTGIVKDTPVLVAVDKTKTVIAANTGTVAATDTIVSKKTAVPKKAVKKAVAKQKPKTK